MSVKYSPQLEEAFRLIREEIDVPGTAKKIDALESSAPKNEIYWADLWSAFMAAAGEDAMNEMYALMEEEAGKKMEGL